MVKWKCDVKFGQFQFSCTLLFKSCTITFTPQTINSGISGNFFCARKCGRRSSTLQHHSRQFYCAQENLWKSILQKMLRYWIHYYKFLLRVLLILLHLFVKLKSNFFLLPEGYFSEARGFITEMLIYLLKRRTVSARSRNPLKNISAGIAMPLLMVRRRFWSVNRVAASNPLITPLIIFKFLECKFFWVSSLVSRIRGLLGQISW